MRNAVLRPWFDRTTPSPRAWPPPSRADAAEALRAIALCDRHGQALHLCAAVVFCYFAALDQAPNSIATGILLGVAGVRALVFPALFTPLLRWPPLWLGLAWVAWSALSTLWSPQGATALAHLGGFRLLLCVPALWPVLGHARLLAWCVVAAAATNATAQIAQELGMIVPAKGPTWRPAGIVALPAVASIWAGGALCVLTGLLCGLRTRAKLAMAPVALVLLAGVVLAASRGPAFALAFAMLLGVVMLLAFRHMRVSAALGLLGVAAALATIAISVLGDDFVRYFGDMQKSFDTPGGFSSIGLRFYWWRLAWEQFLAAPLLGAGLGSFAHFVAAHPDTPGFIESTGISRTEVLQVHPHSTLLRVLAELGVVGAAIFATLLFALLRAGIRNATRDPVATGALSALLLALLSGLSECVESMNIALAFAAIAAALACLPRVRAQ